MAEHGMGWLDWTLMIGFYVALLALIVAGAVLLVGGGRGARRDRAGR